VRFSTLVDMREHFIHRKRRPFVIYRIERAAYVLNRESLPATLFSILLAIFCLRYCSSSIA